MASFNDISPESLAPRDPIARLIYQLGRLPGIGEKTATRLAHHILRQDRSYALALSEAIAQAKERIGFCEKCFNLSEESPCGVCKNASRDNTVICVVERPTDVTTIENTGAHNGSFHVLHGLLSPLDGVGPDDLRIRELLARLQTGVTEVILALNPSVEGDATAMYLARLIQPLGIKATRLAHGIPVGGQLEYSDHQTISRALQNRMEMGL